MHTFIPAVSTFVGINCLLLAVLGKTCIDLCSIFTKFCFKRENIEVLYVKVFFLKKIKNYSKFSTAYSLFYTFCIYTFLSLM